MVVPWTVKRRLKVSGGTSVSPAQASWSRIKKASIPPITRKTRPVTTYMIPSLLWSTVTTQSCRVARAPDDSEVAVVSRTAAGSVDTNIAVMASPQRHEIFDELIELGVVKLHGGHEGSGLERARVFHPGAKVVRRVPHGTGAECRPAHQMGQVRPEHAVTRRAAHGMAVDAGQ